MSFTHPIALILLIVTPLVAYIGRPRYDYRRARDLMSLILRLLIVLLIVLAVSGTQIVRTANRLAVVFLMDVSDSMGAEAREAQIAYIRDSLEHMGVEDEAGLILFGQNALVERPPSPVRELAPVQSTPGTNNTDLAEALRLGLALLPEDAARRLVILSDGRPTVGDSEAAAQLAAATGVEISYVPLARQPSPEIQVTDVRLPTAINAGQEFDLSMTIAAEAAARASVTVLASGEAIHRQEVELRAGTNNYSLALQGGGAGFKDFRVQVDPVTNDGFYQNNQLSGFTQVIGPPRILLVTDDDGEGRFLAPALEEAGLTVDLAQPDDIPIGLAPLAQYSSVILANIPATALSPRRMTALESYVKDLGGGLVVVGGPQTYGAGGYFETPLEAALPVEMRLRDQQRIPQLTIVYVIDRSGSMSVGSPSGIPHIELAKEAMIRSVEFLQTTDRAGVVSFDSQGYWIAEIQPVLDRLNLQRLIASLRAGGGTDILAGMNLVADAIRDDPSQRRHIILLTDGGANPEGLIDLSESLFQESDVTTSVIAIGGGAADFLEDMAVAGGGNYHEILDADSIPAIFTMETVLATRSYITEEEFFPTITANHPIINGIDASPSLFGYVATSPKMTAQVILRGPQPFGDPLLAAWQYGLGRAVAFTSDATARWASNWVQWGAFSRFWSQAVRWTITEGANNLETRVVLEGEQARLIVDARDGAGDFLNGLNLQASLVNPMLEAARRPLQQVAPGRYEMTFTPAEEGAYFLRVTGTGSLAEQAIELNQTTGWVFSYSSEYDLETRADTDLLENIAALTGGRSLAAAPEVVFLHNLDARSVETAIWPWLLIAAAALLPFDIAVRRLIVTRRDLQRARQALFTRSATVATGSAERFSTLRGAKARAAQRTEQQAAPAATAGELRARRAQARAEQREAQPRQTAPRAGQTAKSPPRSPAKPTPQPGGGNVAGEILKRRRERENDGD